MNRTTTALLAAVVGVASLLSAAPARAQMMHVPDSDWRQTDRHDAIVKAAATPKFVVELRFGPYVPNIDASVHAPPGGYGPFQSIFGLKCGTPGLPVGSAGPNFLFGGEVDYVPVRIPYIGAVGPAVGVSYTSFSNKTQFQNQPTLTAAGMCSAETTNLQIMPMHASVALRADELMRRTGVPIVPYGKFGVGVAWWHAYNGTGTETICGSKTKPTNCESATPGGPEPTPIGYGDGLTPSLHFAVGVMLALNFLEPQATARLDETTGVHHAYLFGEYYNDLLTLDANVMHVGASSFVAGLAVDF
jgi:hypothetical protein